jgi:hypothetical protein
MYVMMDRIPRLPIIFHAFEAQKQGLDIYCVGWISCVCCALVTRTQQQSRSANERTWDIRRTFHGSKDAEAAYSVSTRTYVHNRGSSVRDDTEKRNVTHESFSMTTTQ